MVPADPEKVIIHTDGGCEGNPGPGGWAAVLSWGGRAKEIGGGEPATTNNRMELQAAIGALAALNKPCQVEIHTDSVYLRSGITEWIKTWKTKGWVTKARKPVRNEDLWRELDRLATIHVVTWHWLKGHAGHSENERCDLLAKAEIGRIREKFSAEDLRLRLVEFEAVRQGPPQNLSLF